MIIGILASTHSIGFTGFTFGQYPYRTELDTFTIGASLTDGDLKYIPQPGEDTFTVGANLTDGSLVVTVIYNTHDLYDIDTFTIGADLTDGSLVVTANYATHNIYDEDTFTIGASLTDGSLITI